jgi:hypothetical protein
MRTGRPSGLRDTTVVLLIFHLVFRQNIPTGMLTSEMHNTFSIIYFVPGILQHSQELFVHQRYIQWQVNQRHNTASRRRTTRCGSLDHPALASGKAQPVGNISNRLLDSKVL